MFSMVWITVTVIVLIITLTVVVARSLWFIHGPYMTVKQMAKASYLKDDYENTYQARRDIFGMADSDSRASIEIAELYGISQDEWLSPEWNSPENLEKISSTRQAIQLEIGEDEIKY